MDKGVQIRREPESNERQFGNWRGVISAWAIVVALLILLAGVHAVASLRGSAHPDSRLGGAVVPRHDTACGGPGVASAHPVLGCEATPLNEDRSAYW
jgi:hypothetical protein